MQVTRIKALSDRFNRAIILCDSTGAGEPTLENLRAAGCRAEPYPFTQKSKADLVNNLVLMFEQRQLVLPRADLCPELIDELEAFEYSVSENGNVRTSAAGGWHDDCVMALGLAAWQVGPNKRKYHGSVSYF